MPDASQIKLLDNLAKPSEIREQLANHVRELRLLRQMLRPSERVTAELRARRSGSGMSDARERHPLSTGPTHAP